MAVQLELIEMLQGSFSLIFVIISIIVALKIIIRYFEYKSITFLEIGIAWAGMTVPWLPDSINFILFLTSNPFLSVEAYLIIGNSFLMVFVILWLVAFIKLLHIENKKNLILGIAIALSIVFEIFFFILLSINTDLIGISYGPFHYSFSDFIVLYMVSMILIVLVTGLKFGAVSLKSGDPAIVLKGKFLITAFITFTLGAILDAMLSPMLIPITVVLTRVILISSSILFYIGFILPNWVKKIFLKEK